MMHGLLCLHQKPTLLPLRPVQTADKREVDPPPHLVDPGNNKRIERQPTLADLPKDRAELEKRSPSQV